MFYNAISWVHAHILFFLPFCWFKLSSFTHIASLSESSESTFENVILCFSFTILLFFKCVDSSFPKYKLKITPIFTVESIQNQSIKSGNYVGNKNINNYNNVRTV